MGQISGLKLVVIDVMLFVNLFVKVVFQLPFFLKKHFILNELLVFVCSNLLEFINWLVLKHLQCKTCLNYFVKKDCKQNFFSEASVCLLLVFKRCSSFLFFPPTCVPRYPPPVNSPQWSVGVQNICITLPKGSKLLF